MLRYWCAATICLQLIGCSLWKFPSESPSDLPATRPSSNSVSLEKVMLRIPAGDATFNEELWREPDEELFSPQLRRQLAANGIRCGIVGMQLPAVLRDALSQATLSGPGAENGETTVSPTVRLRCKVGDRKELVASPRRDEIAVLCHEDGTVSGQILHDAQCIFAVQCYPKGDGSATFVLTPEIHHGQLRQRKVVSNGAIQLHMKRERKVFSNLQAEVNLSPGQTLILTSTASARALGSSFFQDEKDGRMVQKVLLLRVAQTQRDDLFDPAEAPLPLVSDLDSRD